MPGSSTATGPGLLLPRQQAAGRQQPDLAGSRAMTAQGAPNVPLKWPIEMPSAGGGDDQFGGCRGIEGTYTRIKQIGEGTYGQVGTPARLSCLFTPGQE